jgi:hypothetical protein
MDAAFSALKANSQSWTEEQRERSVSNNTLMDDMDPDEVWTEDGNVVGNR